MGVDFLTCSQCAETFPDCGPHQYCDRGHSLCPNCMGPAGDGAEVPADECPVCLAGGTLLEQSRKRAAEDHATIATLRAERDALAKRVFEKDQGWAECQRDRAAFEDLAKTLEKERDGWKYKYDGALAAIDRVVAQRDAAVARAERMQERAEQHRGDANGFAAENASLRAALTHIAEGNASPAIDYARAALSAAPAATYPPIAQAMREIREAIGDGFTMAAPAATGTEAFWWCPECKAQVDGSAVTYEEHHEACGQRVAAKEAPSPAPHAEAVTRWKAGCPEHVELWNAIHAYADALTPSRTGNLAMMRAVVRVEAAVAALGAAGRG